MNNSEFALWKSLQEDIIDTCNTIVLEKYRYIVDEHINPDLKGDHIAGYSEEKGYFFIGVDGDEFYSKDAKEMKFYIVRNIFYQVGSFLELGHRKENRTHWLYYKDETITDGNEYKKSMNAKYHTSYDPRKYVYDFVIRNLYACFKKELVKPIEKEYTEYLNLWFDDDHWKYVNEEFIEQSDSQDKRIKK